jgi:drug/metabolite transporter (DMT)-like permease
MAWAFAFMGAFNVVIPFLFISWGEKLVPSGLASVLNSTMPLFTIIFAHLWLHDEKISLFRLGGLFIGFLGIIVLLSEELFQKISLIDLFQSNQMISAQRAVIHGCRLVYAIATTFSAVFA